MQSPNTFTPAPRQRRTKELRRCRLSLPGAFYFVTFCTVHRECVISSPEARAACHAACNRLIHDGDVSSLTATVMPDHVHLLFRLGNRLALDRVIAKWRASVRRLLVDLNWQPNYFEHLLRPFEDAESYAWYIFMNPYRAQLIGLNDSWAGWWTDTLVSWRFLSDVLPVLRPLPEWLDMFEGVAHTLATGEM